MVTRFESLRAVSDLDPTGYTQGAQQVEEANRRMERSQGDVTQAVSQTERRIQESATAYDRFVRQLDPAAAAQARLAAQTERVNRWLEQGRITAEQHARAMQLLNQRYSTTATSAQRFASANDNASSSGRNMGQMLGQAGFQIQDFASQVAAGQSALVAFAQQGSQLLGIFGTAGAIAGAILTVGVLAAQLLGLGRSTKEAKSATDEFNEALRKSGEFLETAEERTRRLYEEKRKETQETLRSAAAIQLENIARAQAAEQRAADVLERLQADPRRTPDGARVNQSAIDQAATVATVARQRADEAAAALGRLLDQYEKVSTAQPEAERGIRGVADANADAARGERERIALANQLERDLQDAIDKENALVEARRKLVEEVDALVAAEQRRARETYERQLERSIGAAVDRGADIFYDLFTGRARDFGEVLRQIVARAMAQAAAEVVLRPIVAPIVATALGATGAGGGAVGGLGVASNVSTLTGFSPFSSIGGLGGIGASVNGFGYSSGLFGIGAMNTPAGFSPAASGLLGAGTATQFLGAAGAGFGGGYMLTGLTGNRAIGGIGGAGIGGLMAYGAGFGPWGMAAAAGLGLLGGALGGMGQRGDPYVQGSISLGADGRLVGRAAADNRGDPSGTQQQIDQAIAQLQQLVNGRGLQFTRGADLFGDRTGRTLEQALDEIAAGLRPGSGTGAATTAVLNSGRVTGIESLNALLGRADQFDTLSASLRATFDVTNQAEQQFAALSAQLDEAKVFADEFGISLQGVTAEMAGDFDEQIRRSILGITDANALALEDQDRTNAARLELAKKIGADINQVERLNGLERQQLVDRQLEAQREAREQQVAAVQAWREQLAGVADRMVQEAGRLRQEVDAALLGQYSPLSPEDRLALAQQRFASGQLGLDAYLSEGARAYGTATSAYSGFFYGALDQQRARAASMEATAASLYASLPGFATGGSFDVRGPAGNDNVVFAPGVRFQAGETVNVSRRDTMAQLIERVDRLIALTANAGDQQIGELRGLRRQGASASAMVRLQAAR
ncbi:Bacteriophage lambda, GpH, tail tape measure, N-terminal [uncultured Caudovirales phage]|uniref:Bacteriophage lambda, GpH, tail tape measure, N-terminal n=1 Tax=uncultured Caudovirales phage TaxID=2100421 RepID=A0A6J5MG64_9CAUD|nr:Bacteriophage lambda, GpH, tail tape measure, N-terminal [uncultured Caudovirales phage]